MKLKIKLDREEDGRWIADIPTLPGVMVYGVSREEALVRVQALALQTLSEMLEHGELKRENVVAPSRWQS